MHNTYRIRRDGAKFLIIDDTGETVSVHKGSREANKKIAVYTKDDSMWESARLLVGIAVNAYMKMQGVDKQTAHHWIRDAAD
jgi:hypothetical protein